MWQASCLLLGSPSVESIVSLKRKRKLKNFELGNEIINDIFSSFHEGETKREILVLQVYVFLSSISSLYRAFGLREVRQITM